MQLLLTGVTAREIVSHLMKSVTQAMREFKKGSDTLKRSVGIDMGQIDKLCEALSVVSSAEAVSSQGSRHGIDDRVRVEFPLGNIIR